MAFKFLRIGLPLVAYGFSAIVMSATPTKDGVTKDAAAGKSVVTKPVTSSIVDTVKCPDRGEPPLAGNLLGGLCHYGVPAKGCTSLGTGCRNGATLPPVECVCDVSKPTAGGGVGNPGQIQSPR